MTGLLALLGSPLSVQLAALVVMLGALVLVALVDWLAGKHKGGEP